MRLFPDSDNGRQSVLEDGTLVIERVQREDAGDYICEAQSVAGSAYVKAKLDVKGSTTGNHSYHTTISLTTSAKLHAS